ncbi:hypothetical protein LOTGIDRAFT_234306 [Lottia gigantea]|uniref:Ig-like domain-containing protein n=1 Tax=Lottia gigantea TaxID=225164 RepID=V4A3F6_LOTGI|nr:hypothetical protein LOTGIDRAFT_234306 [Lottia gigantea]ESO89465.1 hypothetical protein LOTGIDRAFT_234306 [Lottia gigantea]
MCGQTGKKLIGRLHLCTVKGLLAQMQLYGNCRMLSSEFVVPDFVSTELGGTIRLECKLVGQYRWYAIAWKKTSEDGTVKQLVNLPIDTRQPEWNKEASNIYGFRYSPIINMDGEITEFSLKIKNVDCSDRGKYSCIVTGNFPEKTKDVTVEAISLPTSPTIEYDKLVIERNSTFELTCEAEIGLPSSNIVWLRKTKDSNVFERLDDQGRSAVTDITACEKRESSSIDIFVSDESDGSIYRCALHGRHNEAKFYDEVKVELAEIPTTADPGNDSDCDGTVCISENKDPTTNDSGNSSTVRVYSFILLSLSLLYQSL